MKHNKFYLIASLLLFLNLYSQKQFVFFGSYNWDKTTEGLYVYQLDPATGKLSKVTSVSNVVNPSYLTISPNGKYIYAVTDSKIKNSGSVSAFEFNPDKKALTFINNQKSGGENPVYVNVSKDGKWLVNANYTEGSVSVFPISENGKIDSIAQNIQYTEGSVIANRQDRSHVHSTVFSPNFDYLFLADLGADKIRIYPFDPSKKEILNVEKSTFIKTELGSGPRHFIFSPNAKFAYCIEELSGTISAYRFDNNVLNPVQIIATHPETIKEGFESSDVHISPDGRFLYATNRGKEDNIAIFSIDADGLLKHVGYQSTLGKHPRTFIIDETGNFLIVTNVKTQNVVVFKRNSETGLLKKVGKKIKIKNLSCVKTKVY